MKALKAAVRYRAAKPDAYCSICAHFLRAQRQCTKVNGTISSNAWCTLFERTMT